MEERIGVGALGGLIGGTVSGLFLQRAWEELPLAVFLGEAADHANWTNHLVLALVFGMLYGAFVGRFASTLIRNLILGPISSVLAWYGATKLGIASALQCQLADALIAYSLLGVATGLVFWIATNKRELAPPFP
ncbi:MAG: hypothetical protein H0Z38_09430 [Firmicutes bacterium]|nr:hypothetical protein [Bacillota bacterium]